MRVIDSLSITLLLVGCGSSTPASEDVEQPLADAMVDPDALEQSATPTRTLDDPDAPPPRVPLDIRDATLRTIDGTPLTRPTQREQSRRMRLSAELGDLRSIEDDELESLRLHWYTRGAGIVLQNTSAHPLALSVHFRASRIPRAARRCTVETCRPAHRPRPSPLLRSAASTTPQPSHSTIASGWSSRARG